MGGNGAVAPHAAMTKTGHQAQRNVVNPADTDADVVTAFHPDSETERTLLFGTNFVEIQPSTAASDYGTSQTFTFSNDVDAIGDVYVRVKVDFGQLTTIPAANALLRLIQRAEVMVGNSTWQTMENADIIAMMNTTMDYGAAVVANVQGGGGFYTPDGTGPDGFGNAINSTSTAGTREAWFPLNIFTAGGPARAHLVAGAPHQSFRIKLTYATVGALGVGSITPTKPLVEMWARQHIMTNFERDQIRSNTIAKSLYLTQHMEQSVSGSGSTSVECDSFSLLASHLLVTLEKDNLPGDAEVLQTVELLLNTSSHSGQLDAGFMVASTGNAMGLKTYTTLTPLSGFGGTSSAVEDIDGGSSAGSIARVTYVFPIAATPWGPDGCPFNRFDTIRLKLSFQGNFTGTVSVTCCGTASAVYAKQAASLQYHS
jgi:hypothetical protein